MAQHSSTVTPVEAGASAGDALDEVIAEKLRQGYWVESQSPTHARLIARGRKRWLGLFGRRLPEKREIVTVDEQGRTTLERLPARRY
jgi:hypothetical protein